MAKQVWEAVKNDGTPDKKKFLGILTIPQMKINPESYALYLSEFVDMLKKANAYQYYIKNYNLAKWAIMYKEYRISRAIVPPLCIVPPSFFLKKITIFF